MARNSKSVDVQPQQQDSAAVPPWKVQQPGEQSMPAVDPPLLDPQPPATPQPAPQGTLALPVQRPAGMLPDEVQQHIAQVQQPQRMGSTDVEMPGMKVAKLAPINDGKVVGSVVGRHGQKDGAAPSAQRYRVVGSPGMVSMSGRMVRIGIGKVVDDTNYDIKRLKQQGVQLAAVQDGE
jgi:hypothetical protein